jgi:hypothetical protein
MLAVGPEHLGRERKDRYERQQHQVELQGQRIDAADVMEHPVVRDPEHADGGRAPSKASSVT